MSELSVSGETTMSGSMYASFHLPLSASDSAVNHEEEDMDGSPAALADLDKVCTVGSAAPSSFLSAFPAGTAAGSNPSPSAGFNGIFDFNHKMRNDDS